MKGMFIPEITVEMFRNACLESIETLMAEGEVYDIEYDPKSEEQDVPDTNVGKWIPCSDRMPGMETDVLLQFSGNMCVGFLTQDNDWKIYSGGCWLTDILEGDLQPTAWMPLPEPYREDGAE